MSPRRARALKSALSQAYPEAADIQVTPSHDGAQIVISGVTVCGNSAGGCDVIRASVGNRRKSQSLFLQFLLAGRP